MSKKTDIELKPTIALIHEEDQGDLEAESKAVQAARLMDEILKNSPNTPVLGALVEGTVIGKSKMTIYIDLPPFGTGIIFGREYLNARDIIKKVNIGDIVTAKVVEPNGDNGYVELSLKEAKQAIFWSEAAKAIKQKTVFDIVIKDANKGGLIVDWQGMDGFLPASQLKQENYPRIDDGDKDKITEELRKLVGKTLSLSIIGADAAEGKLIFSEKNGDAKNKKEIVEKYALGDVLDGEVTGLVDFGIFVKVAEGLEGLVHISELDWGLVENPRGMFKVGDKVKTKVIEVKDGKISLSIKALKTNPWKEVEGKYKKGDSVNGIVIKYNKYGALVSVEEGVAGLVHVSEFTSIEDLKAKLELGKSYPFTITLFDAKEHKMTLAFTKVV